MSARDKTASSNRRVALCGRGAGLLLLALTVLHPAAAQQATDAEWDKLVAAAKQEGEIVLITPPSATHREFLAQEWPKDFPEIKLSQTSVPPGQQFTRLSVERNAGKYLWDLAFTGTDNAFQLRDAGMLDPVRPEFVGADVKNPATWGGWDDAFEDTAKEYVFSSRTFLKMPFYNASCCRPTRSQPPARRYFSIRP